jgi:hypothetical protein
MSQRIKLVVALLLLLIAGALILNQAIKPGPLKNSIMFRCVETQEVFSLNRSSINRIPAQNPETGEFTLLPIYQDENGDWQYSPRYADLIPDK